MIIIMQKDAREADIASVEKILSNQGIHSERLIGEKQTVVGIIGASHGLDISSFTSLAGVQEVIRVNSPVKLASRTAHPEDTVITFNDGTKSEAMLRAWLLPVPAPLKAKISFAELQI